MAGVNWEKCHGGTESQRLLRHNDKEMRLGDTHKNKHIDITKTHLNWQMYDGYNKTCDRMNTKLDELDSITGANRRKDRVTMFSLEYPVPEGLPDGKVHEWHLKVHEIMRGLYGADLFFVNSYEHFDEVHEYRNSQNNELTISRVHVHDCVVPIKDGKLNGKEFSARRNMTALNRQIHKMTERDYGLQFMTGERKKDSRTVEELKNQSEIAQIRHDSIQQVKNIIENRKMPVSGKFEAYLANLVSKNGTTAKQMLEKWWNDFQEKEKQQAVNEIDQAMDEVVMKVHGKDDNTSAKSITNTSAKSINNTSPQSITNTSRAKTFDYFALQQQVKQNMKRKEEEEQDEYGQ